MTFLPTYYYEKIVSFLAILYIGQLGGRTQIVGKGRLYSRKSFIY